MNVGELIVALVNIDQNLEVRLDTTAMVGQPVSEVTVNTKQSVPFVEVYG